MSNRLEQEFPEVAWRAMPPVGPGRVPPEAMRASLDRGRRLRNQAMRNGIRFGGAAVRRRVASLVAPIRCAARALAGRRPARDCLAEWVHGA